jgi:NADPH:quinone reductase-like Zn-dependent oxidoreductase
VLIHAGSGGVGTYAIQLAKHLGATVATTTGTGNVDWVRDLGADIVIDYRTQDFETVVHDYDVVLDSQGGDTLAKSLRVLKPGGTAIGIAGPPDPDFARQLGRRFPLRLVMALLSWKTRRAARRRGVRYAFLFMRASGAQLDEITKLIHSGCLRPMVDQTYPFDKAPQASLTSKVAAPRARSSSRWPEQGARALPRPTSLGTGRRCRFARKASGGRSAFGGAGFRPRQ